MRASKTRLEKMTNASASISDKEKLELEQLHLNNEKLRAELGKLKQDAKPDAWWSRVLKRVAAFGAAAAVITSFFGILDSYNKTIVDRRQSRVSEQRVLLSDAIKQLQSSSTISKLLGVSVLSGYLESHSHKSPSLIRRLFGTDAPSDGQDPIGGDINRQILFTLGSLIATDKDPQVQAAVMDLTASIPKDGPISAAEWRYFQDMLMTQSRVLMTKGDLLNHRHFAAASPLSDEEQAARAVGKLIALNARKDTVPEYRDFRGIYCGECDFRNVTFPDAVDFTGAVLDDADFSRATMPSAIFNNAEIAGARFVESDLRDAQFRSVAQPALAPIDGRAPRGRTAYIDHIASALDKNAIVKIRMPNFSCANLERARFEWHALFPGEIYLKRTYTKGDQAKVGWYESMPDYLKDRSQKETKIEFNPIRVTPPKFFKAIIRNAQLEHARFFDFIGVNDDFPDITDGYGIRIGDIASFQGSMADDGFQLKFDDDKKEMPQDKSDRNAHANEELRRAIRLFQGRLRGTFYSVDLDGASLPGNLMAFLKQKEPTIGDFTSAFRDTFGYSTADDPDLKCDRKYNE